MLHEVSDIRSNAITASFNVFMGGSPPRLLLYHNLGGAATQPVPGMANTKDAETDAIY